MYKHTLKKNTPSIFIQAAFICIFLCISQLTALGASVNIGSGTYSQTIKGPAVLSGNINIRIPGSTESATSSQSGIYANNGNSITGTVQSLNIITNSDNIAGITTVGSLIDLEGNCFIQTSGLYSNGITYSGNPGGGGVRLNGNTTIITLGDYAYGVFAMGSQNDYSLITKGTLNISTSGTGSYGIYLHDGTILLNSNTNITTTGASAHGIYASADSTLQLNGPTSISVTGEGAYALLVDGIAPYSESFISTRANSTDSPNPQQINIDGPIRIYGKGNELLLDLAAGSHVNSQVLEADSGGSIILNFFAPDAQWTTGSGSLISNGAQLQLDFTQGGSWQLPVTDQENLSTTDPSPALVITDTANMTITGSTEIQGAMNTSLSGGDSAKFALVQAQGSNPLDPSLDSMNVVSNNILYTLDNLGIETINGMKLLSLQQLEKNSQKHFPTLELEPEICFPMETVGFTMIVETAMIIVSPFPKLTMTADEIPGMTEEVTHSFLQFLHNM